MGAPKSSIYPYCRKPLWKIASKCLQFKQRKKEGSRGRFALRYQLWKERATKFKRQSPAETAGPARSICGECDSDHSRISVVLFVPDFYNMLEPVSTQRANFDRSW